MAPNWKILLLEVAVPAVALAKLKTRENVFVFGVFRGPEKYTMLEKIALFISRA